MAHAALWLMDSRRLGAATIEQFEKRLSPMETDRYGRFHRPERRRQYLLGRMLVREAVGALLGLPPAAISTLERPGLAPQLLLPAGHAPAHFSLSHSRHWIGCAVSSDTALGLDIEAMRADRDIASLAEAAFHPAECTWLQRQTSASHNAAFHRLWTMKEALFKLASNADAPKPALPSVLTIQDELLMEGDDWFCATLPHAELCIALCAGQHLQIELSEPSDWA